MNIWKNAAKSRLIGKRRIPTFETKSRQKFWGKTNAFATEFWCVCRGNVFPQAPELCKRIVCVKLKYI